MKELNTRIQRCAETFLNHKGYNILESNWKSSTEDNGFDIIATEDNALVFIELTSNDSRNGSFGFGKANTSRKSFENMAMEYLISRKDLNNISIRFDVLGISVLNDDRAMLRHYINAFTLAN